METPEPKYKPNQQVNIIVVAATPLGFKCLINDVDDGILYANEVFEELRAGQHTVAYVNRIREDGKIDLIMQPHGSFGMDTVGEKIMKMLGDRDGYLPIDAKTEAQEIYEKFGVSKKKFKMALGGLYKKRLVVIGDDGIRLASQAEPVGSEKIHRYDNRRDRDEGRGPIHQREKRENRGGFEQKWEMRRGTEAAVTRSSAAGTSASRRPPSRSFGRQRMDELILEQPRIPSVQVSTNVRRRAASKPAEKPIASKK